MNEPLDYREIMALIGQWLTVNYWGPMFQQVQAEPRLLATMPGFLLKPDKIIFYLSRNHIGIEYIGPERITELPTINYLDNHLHDYSRGDRPILDEIVGFDYSSGAFRLPLSNLNEDIVLPTNAGAAELFRLGWNWAAQSMMVGFNVAGFEVPIGQFVRIVNARFFDASEKDGLKTRHIKWLDLIPCEYVNFGNDADVFKIRLYEIYARLVETDVYANYPLPADFRMERLQQMNRVIEFVGEKANDEPSITRLLASEDLQFVLKMRFSAKEVRAECLCEWQSEKRKPIKPDFFVVGTNGYAEIVEFKLPEIGSKTVVGSNNRESFSSGLNSYISQTRVYREYFDDPNNRAFVKWKFGFDVYKPRRHLVVGRRWHFNSSEWRAIAADYADITIHTYDDLIDGVIVQFYN